MKTASSEAELEPENKPELESLSEWNDAAAWVDTVDPYPSEGELLFDVNMSLAYGAKSIQYFLLIQPQYFANQTGGTALYVVNYSRTEKGDVTLRFDRQDYLYEVIQRAESGRFVGNAVPLRLDAGEGALIVLA